MSADKSLEAPAPHVEQPAGDTHVAHEAIPAVCFIDDVARHIKSSRRTISRLRRFGAFPIPELPSIDNRARWSGEQVKAYIDGKLKPVARGWKKRA